jgi:hypothetical protein
MMSGAALVAVANQVQGTVQVAPTAVVLSAPSSIEVRDPLAIAARLRREEGYGSLQVRS